ncbi:hybrid sensor histidine kinase/response regulator [Undibacterium sp.]|jgi:two-component system chemotaxis sensor kinase CheA|uniref:hybrid sensor histidine kinase/response regulator n=1 Tax=Undibacterium sp. TaxID=1914977 RepID=UPI002B6EDB92|nr:response regulator [Undibacterium sp.]HTD06107.1 response regulator [Undibacterium sp.]
MAKDPYRYFRIEARELLDQLSAGILDLEKLGNADKVSGLLRLAHTLKGAAHVVRQAQIANLAHMVEDTLAPHRQDGTTMPRSAFDDILKSLDQISVLLDNLPQADASEALAPKTNTHAGTAADTATPAPTGKHEGIPNQAVLRMARTDISVVDALLEGLAEVSGELGNMKRLNASVSHIRELFTSFSAQLAAQSWKESHLHSQPTNLSKVGGLVESLRGLVLSAERNIAACTESMERELRQVHEIAERLRLIPVASIFNTLERTARDAANSLEKQVNLDASGGDIRLDGQVLDVVQNALMQIIRNAVAHGIELPRERGANHKSAAGNITLEVTRRANHVSFRCTDDGRGIDTDAVRRAILRKELAAGTMSEQTEEKIEALSIQDLLSILTKGGVSTAKTITELSGRGVGLDLVRSSVQQIGGEMIAHTEAGRGTSVELLVPVSLASLQALIVESSGQPLAIPLDAVQSTLRVAGSDIVHAEQGRRIVHQGTLIPLIKLSLAGRMHSARPAAPHILSAVVINTAAGAIAVAVDKLRGTESIVLRPLPAMAPASAMISASFLDHEGNPQLVLDPEMLASGMHSTVTHANVSSDPSLPILVIDDSLTTRMLESSILEAAGFGVALAASAEEGLALALRNQYALFLVDLEMPGMDGIEFIEHTRADPVLRSIPCILVTSRDAAEDKQRAEQAGASAYIVKGEFNQVEFLRRIRQLVQA